MKISGTLRWYVAAVFVVVVVLLLLAGLGIFRPSQPTYQGISLETWLEQLATAYPRGYGPGETWQDSMGPSQKEAAHAVRSMSDDTLPILIDILRTGNLPSHNAWREAAKTALGDSSDLVLKESHRKLAAFGLAALGSNAAPAVDELARAMEHEAIEHQAAVALASIGPIGWQALTRELTNQNEYLRIVSATTLGNYRAAVPGTVENLMFNATNHESSTNLVSASIAALGAIHQDAEIVVPVPPARPH